MGRMSILIYIQNNIKNVWAFCWGCLIGILGGLIGLGGAEFRLPVLVGIFKYRILTAIIINLIVSFVTVVFSFLFRTKHIDLSCVVTNTPIILNILFGTLIGSYIGVNLATKINEQALYRIVTVFLVGLSAVLIGHDLIMYNQGIQMMAPLRIFLGFIAGIGIGVFSSMLGVAGGELIIPTIILLFSVDIKIAGSLSLAISIPTIAMGLVKYKDRQLFHEIRPQFTFIIFLSLGSIAGALIGSYLLSFVSVPVLHVILGAILLISAIKMAIRKK